MEETSKYLKEDLAKCDDTAPMLVGEVVKLRKSASQAINECEALKRYQVELMEKTKVKWRNNSSFLDEVISSFMIDLDSRSHSSLL